MQSTVKCNQMLGISVDAIETHVVNVIFTAKVERVRIDRDLDVLLVCMQSSLKVGVLEILMPNMSHRAAGRALTRTHQFPLGACTWI